MFVITVLAQAVYCIMDPFSWAAFVIGWVKKTDRRKTIIYGGVTGLILGVLVAVSVTSPEAAAAIGIGKTPVWHIVAARILNGVFMGWFGGVIGRWWGRPRG